MRVSRFVASFCALILFGASAVAAQSRSTSRVLTRRPPAAAQPATESHTIGGVQAWAVARTNGFTFRPVTAGSDQSVARPYDGVNTRLVATVPDNRFGGLRTIRATVASVVGGNMSVSRRSWTATFEMFGDRTLAPGWSVEEVKLSGSYVWDRRPAEGSDDLSFRVKSSSGNSTSSVIVRSVTLRGPAGADWQDAFVGRQVYTITGTEAWATAKTYGYEFNPVPEYDDVRLYGGLDGTRTYMKQDGAGCGRYGSANAEVVGGNMISHCPQKLPNNHRDETTDFRMFAGKTLASGWTVREIVVTGGSWVERPAPGSTSLEFVYRLTRAGTSALVTRIVLEGPSDAPSWEDAFKVN